MAPSDSLFFVQHGSKDLSKLEAALTTHHRRCDMMMVKSCEQAQVILRRDDGGRHPDLVIIWGATTDTRAAQFAKTLRGKATMVVLADDASLEEAAKESGARVSALPMPIVERLLADESFWWVVVRFAQ